MSRKHFTALAEAIRAISDPAERRRAAALIADVCQSANPRFDRQRFYAACNVEGY